MFKSMLLQKSFLVLMVILLAGLTGCLPEEEKKTSRSVDGVVLDTSDNPLADVLVSAHGKETTTDAEGKFSLTGLDTPSDRMVLDFVKEGFFKNTVGKKPTKGVMNVKVVLMPRTKIGTVDNSAGGTLNTADGSFSFPASAFGDGSGSTSGNVDIYAGVITPDQSNFGNAMPGGDFSAQDQTGDDGVLSSFMAMNIEAEDSAGNAVDLREAADICLNIPASIGASAPATVPVWITGVSGVWEEVGTATKTADGLQYCFFLDRTGAVNCDLFSRSAILEGKACSLGEALPNSEVKINNQITVYTDSKGEFSALVPSGQQLTVTAGSDVQTVGPLDAGTVTEVEYGLCKISSGTYGFCAENYPTAACEILADQYVTGYSGTSSEGFQLMENGSCAAMGFKEWDPNSGTQPPRFYLWDYAGYGYGSSEPLSSCAIWWTI